MARMDTLLYFQSTATTSAHHKLDGICQAAKTRGWLVNRFDLHSPTQIRDEILHWHPVGCIVEFSSDDIVLPRWAQSLVPTVLLDCNPVLARRRVSTVTQDPATTGALAADFLLQMDLAAYAYAGWPERKFWDRMRGRSFCRAVKAARKPLFRIDVGDAAASVDRLRAAIAASLRTLPRPVGVYCVNDAIGAQTMEAAAQCGFTIPDDIVLLGTDNEEHICENISPTLSSIELDFLNAGRRCVEIIAALVGNGGSPPVHETFGPARIIRRSSTRRAARPDRGVIAALDLIRSRATEGLSPSEVASLFHCSRRMAEIRFRATTGHSILDEIHAVQIEHAKNLIANPYVKLTVIPQMCGYGSNAFFMGLFRRITGLTMRQWRRTCGDATARRGTTRRSANGDGCQRAHASIS